MTRSPRPCTSHGSRIPRGPGPAARRAAVAGFSLLELLVVLAVAGFLVYQLGPRITQTFAGAKRAEITTEFQFVSQAIRDTRSMTGDYGTGDITSVVINGGGVPANLIRGTALQNLYGGGITVTGANAQAVITFAGLPRDACQRLAANVADGSAGGASAVSINGTAQSTPVAIAAAQSGCSQSGSGSGAGNVVAITVD